MASVVIVGQFQFVKHDMDGLSYSQPSEKIGRSWRQHSISAGILGLIASGKFSVLFFVMAAAL